MTATIEDIGWQVIDPDGNIVDSGPISVAHMTSEMLQGLQEIIDSQKVI